MPLSSSSSSSKMLKFMCECPHFECSNKMDISPDEYLAAYEEYGQLKGLAVVSVKCKFLGYDQNKYRILYQNDRYLIVDTHPESESGDDTVEDENSEG